MREIDRAILSSRSLEELSLDALKSLYKLVPCDRISLILFDFENARSEIIASIGSGRSLNASSLRIFVSPSARLLPGSTMGAMGIELIDVVLFNSPLTSYDTRVDGYPLGCLAEMRQ